MSMSNVERKPPTGNRWRDVCLARISHVSGREDTETSTESQADEMQAFSHAHNGTVVKTFVERGKSAYKNKARRPDLESAIRMIEAGTADRLIVWKLDRWIRNVRELAKLIDRVEKAGGTFASKCEPWCDTSSPIGYALVILIGALAEIESDNRRDRALPFHNQRTRKGLVPGGPRPYGYIRGTIVKGEFQPARNVLTVDPSEAKIIKECARRVIKGDSLRGIATDLAARGVPTGNEGSTWTHTLVKRIVTNPTTAGMRKHDGGFVKGTAWKAILNESDWQRCCVILNDSSRRVSYTNGLAHFLSGIMTCGKNECGGSFFHTTHTNGDRYRCKVCGHSISDAVTEDFVSGYLLHSVDADAWESMRARGQMVDRAAMDRMNAKLEHERNRWWNDEIDDDDWNKAQAQHKARMESLTQADALDLPDWSNLHEAWPTADAEDKRTVVAAVFESITVLPRTAGINGTQRIVCIKSDAINATEVAA